MCGDQRGKCLMNVTNFFNASLTGFFYILSLARCRCINYYDFRYYDVRGVIIDSIQGISAALNKITASPASRPVNGFRGVKMVKGVLEQKSRYNFNRND